MKLLQDWKSILRNAWSIRWIALAVLLSGVEAALAFVQTDPTVGKMVPTGVFAVLSAFVSAFALLARVMSQKPPEAPAVEKAPE